MKPNTPKHRNTRCRRRGAVMVAAIICLLLTTALLGSLLKLAVIGRRQTESEQQLVQARWLAESALQRAAHRLQADDAYTGETWQIAAEKLDGYHAAAVEIRTETPEQRPNERIVTVEAKYPAGAVRFAKRTKQVTVRINPNSREQN